jgi:serine protease AprX
MRNRVFASPALVSALFLAFATGAADTSIAQPDLHPLAEAAQPARSRVIVIADSAASMTAAAAAIQRAGGTVTRALPIINAHAAQLPAAVVSVLAANPAIARIAIDRRVSASMERTGATVGATSVRRQLGYDGSGVGVAIIDSGITSWHDDLADGGAQRVDRFVDLVNARSDAYDDHGHGTHVSGIVAGDGYDSNGARSGIAPKARLISIKVLDATGVGYISDVIAALDYVLANRAALNIRVVNLSIATTVDESYETDPLTVAAKKVVKAGVVVVAAAGNYGRDAWGRTMYRGITAPGNAPWVLTVGASSHMGTTDRSDDTMAPFSSHGPSAINAGAKPDIVAPGVGIESLADPNSAWYTSQAAYLLPGTTSTSYLPYLSQSGTSMATPVVTGTVALMLQANPKLTPNAVKAILQYTAQTYAQYDPLTQGAGFLDADGAVRLARFFAAPTSPRPTGATWSKHVIWGNRMVSGGRLTPDANAWDPAVVWGAIFNGSGQTIGWGEICRFTDCYTDGHQWSRWRITCSGDGCSDANWSNGTAHNVVWGALCGGSSCNQTWSLDLFTATQDGDTVVWGTKDGDTVVWGTGSGGDTVVWGTYGDGDTVVWGTGGGGDTVVWGTTCPDSSCVPVIWKR